MAGLAIAAAGVFGLLAANLFAKEILNVSYDPTREFYTDYNAAFAKHWKETQHEELTINQSHGGSGKQARAVIDGLEADVVTLALSYDIDQIAAIGKLLPADWQHRLPNNSAPYRSTIVFLVRKGNPKGIKDWGDLIKPGIEVIAPSPKTSGGARYDYLAAWGWSLKQSLGDRKRLDDPASAGDVKAAQVKAQAFVKELYQHVPVLDSGARGATTTFVQREQGDVLLTWENEALLAVREFGAGRVEIVVPPLSILAEPPVATVDANVGKHGTTEAAKAYLEYLYSREGQRIAAKHGFRPSRPDLAEPDDLKKFPNLELFTVEEVFGGWGNAQKVHFDDGGIFDRIYQP
jgi:sulfate transport system substrate-binding protein